MLLGEMIEKIGNLRETIRQNIVDSMELTMVLSKLYEAEYWIHKCMPAELIGMKNEDKKI